MITKKKIKINDILIEEVTVSMDDISVSIMNYGATITSLQVPNHQGDLENIVLSYSDLKDYIKNPSCLNAVIGPTSGRIENSNITINNKTIFLDKNFLNQHQLHGGQENFAYQLFDISVEEHTNYVDVICSLHIDNKDSLYPGTKDITITYTIKPSILGIRFEGVSDQDTYLNLTSHLYFNLSGERSNITNHQIMIDADKLVDVNEEFIPVEVKDTSKLSLNMTSPTYLRDLLTDSLVNSPIKGIDHPFILNKKQIIDASLYDPESKRFMEITTTYPVIVCYTHNHPEDKQLTNNTKNKPYQGVCFETQLVPNPERFPNLRQSYLSANRRYNEYTEYTFSIKKES